ncbi:MAG TPA: hypothetical protein VGE52_02940, partial [Pirellulales bacterium]
MKGEETEATVSSSHAPCRNWASIVAPQRPSLDRFDGATPHDLSARFSLRIPRDLLRILRVKASR